LVDQTSVFPFQFTQQPFQARLSISLPIFTNFSRTQRISEARAQHGDLEEAVRARGLAVQTEVSQAFLTLQTAFRTTGLQDTNRSAAREQLQLATSVIGSVRAHSSSCSTPRWRRCAPKVSM